MIESKSNQEALVYNTISVFWDQERAERNLDIDCQEARMGVTPGHLRSAGCQYVPYETGFVWIRGVQIKCIKPRPKRLELIFHFPQNYQPYRLYVIQNFKFENWAEASL